jgi:hypothetical protein
MGPRDLEADDADITWRMPAGRRVVTLVTLIAVAVAASGFVRSRELGRSVTLAAAVVGVATCAVVVWRIFAVGIVTRGDELVVTNAISRHRLHRRDVRGVVAMEDRPLAWVQSRAPWIGSRPSLVFIVRNDGSMVPCHGLSPEWRPDTAERIAQLQRWAGGASSRTLIPLSLRRPSGTMRHRH